MAVAVEDLKSPKGEFTVEMFPELEGDLGRFDAKLDGYIEAGKVQAAAIGLSDPSVPFDRATKAWATLQGVTDVYNRMLTTPISVEMKDKGQAAFSATQFKLWADKVAKYEAEFESEITLVSSAPPARPSGRVRHRISLTGL